MFHHKDKKEMQDNTSAQQEDMKHSHTFHNPFADSNTSKHVTPTSAQSPEISQASSQNEGWHFKLTDRNASTPASEAAETGQGTSQDQRDRYVDLMQKTKGMNPEQVKAFLKTQSLPDGAKIMRGEDGYLALVGPDGGAF